MLKKMKYKFLPHTADIIFEAYGKTLESLFENSALALEEIMVDIKTLETKEHYEIFARCEGDFINRETQDLHDDAKAITMHEFEIIKEEDKWKAKVLVDI